MATNTTTAHPRVGVAAIVKSRDGKLIIGRRQGAHGAGTWQFPGGHLEFGEDVEECARRETLEETGLAVRTLGLMGVTNDKFVAENKHYITLFVLCVREDEEKQPENLEPHKCEGWYWKDWTFIAKLANKGADAEDRLFLPIVNLIEQITEPPWVGFDAE
ncbi:nudix domain containing protein [Niveomyces insectorum RCEF 264]|uniref:Nudix domain containing protein n=1 Tax=Niveomyces insectorum RCEF 264 TaxID=1081102 RepID=A0A167N820_9HYPO|nr:nudix domain containing protein [Niveomyces insectorum RCEF 264]